MSRQSELKLANKQLKEGNELEEQGKYKEGLELFQQASTFYEKWEQWEEWVKVNINIGSIHSRRMQDKNGIAPLLQVLERGKKYLGKEHPLVGNCLREIGTYHAILGKYELALTYFLDALAIQRKKLGERHSDVAKSLNGTGLCYYSTGDYDLAIYYIKDAFEIFKENFGKNHFQVANMLNNLGMCLFEKSNYPLAIEYHQKALAIKRENWGEEHPSVALSLNNIGVCHLGRGDWDLAIQYHQEALAIRKKILGEESFDAAMSKNNLGVCYLDKKDYKLAIVFLQESLLVWRKILGEEHPKVAYSLLNLGLLYHFKGDNDLAIEYLQESLIIRKKSLGEVHPLVANVLEVIGLCYFAKEAYDLAISFSKEASAIFREKFGEKYARIAVNLHLLGNCYFAKEAYHLAIASYQNALIIFIPSFNQKNIFQNPILQGYNAGFLLLDTLYRKTKTLLQFYNQEPQSPKYLQAAFSTITLATDLVSEVRQSYKAEGSKHSLAENAAKVYHQAIDIALKTSRVYTELSQIPQHAEFTNIPYTPEGAENLAFDFAEQSKAVLLLSNFKDSEAKVNSNIPTALLEKEQELKIELSYLEKSIVTQNGKGEEKDEALLTKFQRQYFKQKQQYYALIKQFETDYPEYYQLKYSVSTASVQDLQNYLSKMSQKVSDTLFYDKKLDFDMLKSKIETLEVSDTSPSKRNSTSTIKQSRGLGTSYTHSAILSYHITDEKIYIFVITSDNHQIVVVQKPEGFSDSLEELQVAIEVGYLNNFVEYATQLFDLLLRPVWNHLQGVTKLIIIPHGELYYIPFDVLLNQHQITDTKSFQNLPYLIRGFEISYHYSATLLLHSHQRQLQTGEQVDSFFGLAPVHFGGEEGSEKKEGYVVKSGGKQSKKVRRILKSSGNVQGALQDLEETEAEVKEVYQLFEQEGKEAIALFYDQASKQNLQEHIGGYKYVLISTHGFLQETGKNTLSGIHLASQKRQTIDGGRQTRLEAQSDDFILHTSETYHLNLNADLVVLSSCESGVGELKVGEGMMALNRGFLYAGASNIVYSLFKVPEDSTSQLTQALFRYILEGNGYAQALRKAKLELINDGATEPMDWAGFALVGG